MELLQKMGFGFLAGAGKASRARGAANGPVPAAEPAAPAKGPKSKGETVGQRRRMANRPPSFTDLLPYVSYDAQERVFVLKDGSTLGAFFELAPVPTEAQGMDYLLDRAHKVQEALQAIPESDASPWVVQFFMNDDRNIDGLNDYLRDYIGSVHASYPDRQRAVLDSDFTREVLSEVAEHLALVSRPEGLFTDTQVTGQVWRGQQRRVRCCVYKRFGNLSEDPAPAVTQIESVAITLMATLTEAGVQAKRCTGKDLYEWLLPFFNRQVPWASHGADLLRLAPYTANDAVEAGQTQGPGGAPLFGWDLSDMLNLSEPRSDMDAGLFEFDGIPVKALALQSMRSTPQIGHFSAELQSGHESFARFDRLPAGSML